MSRAVDELTRLLRLRWGVRALFALGVAASVVANVLHAQPNPISRVLSSWPSIALLLTVDLVSRIPVSGSWRSIVRVGATTVVALIAAWVSYWHMVEVSIRYGETDSAPYMLPVSVDGLIVVATVSLLELGRRIQALSLSPSAGASRGSVSPDSAAEPSPLNGHGSYELSGRR